MKKKILIILMIIILICMLSIIGIVIYEKHINNSSNTSIVVDKLYGYWYSTHLEIYENGEIKFDLIDINDKMLNIYSDSQISICSSNEELKCTDTNYSIKDNKIFIEDDSTYLKSGSQLIMDNEVLIIKNTNNEDNYTLLYFERK